ncbi:MAG: hypothetical protein KatS3mg032_1740 [Cyclobacteriaceae bacterium]|nr:MAG: hypothetical protein KatS3mg032_1740 [Cyclobacteriaceae bacterium]
MKDFNTQIRELVIKRILEIQEERKQVMNDRFALIKEIMEIWEKKEWQKNGPPPDSWYGKAYDKLHDLPIFMLRYKLNVEQSNRIFIASGCVIGLRKPWNDFFSPPDPLLE